MNSHGTAYARLLSQIYLSLLSILRLFYLLLLFFFLSFFLSFFSFCWKEWIVIRSMADYRLTIGWLPRVTPTRIVLCGAAWRGRRAARHTRLSGSHTGRAESSRKKRDSRTRVNARQHHSRLSDVPRVAFNSPSTYSAINDSHHRPRLWPLPSLWP